MRVAFRLARELKLSIRGVLEMDAWEWAGWVAYCGLEPFGPLREDMRAAQITIAALSARGVRLKPEDVFASLQESRPRGRDGGAAETRHWLVSNCPALTDHPIS